jgi:hypothetical protein
MVTRIKILQLVNKLCSHCLFPVVDKSGTSGYHLVTMLMRPTDSQQVAPASLVSSARNKLLTSWWQQGYEQPVQVLLEQLVATLLPPSTLACNKMITTCSRLITTTANKQCMGTHPDIGLTTTLLQLVCRSVTTFLSVYNIGQKLLEWENCHCLTRHCEFGLREFAHVRMFL